MKALTILILTALAFFNSSNEDSLKLEIKIIRKVWNDRIRTKVICTYINDSDSLFYLDNPLCRNNLNLLPLHGKIRLKPAYYANVECKAEGTTLQPHSRQEFILKESLETMFQDVNSKDTTTLKIIYYGRIVSSSLKPIDKPLESNQIIVNY